MSIRSLCSRHRVRIGRGTATAGTSGSLSYTYADQGEKQCWVQPRGSGDDVEASLGGSVKYVRVYFAEDPSVKNGDHVRWKDTSEIITATGNSYNMAGMDRLWAFDGVIDERHQDEDVDD